MPTVRGPTTTFLLSGTGMRANCAYASTVAHDCHNLMVVGTSDEAMAIAANALIESEGGIAIVVDGKLDAVMALPLAGLMTLESAEVAAAQVIRIERSIAKTGCPHSKMEMTLSFAALPVLEELHITNRGYVLLKEGKAPELVPLIVK